MGVDGSSWDENVNGAHVWLSIHDTSRLVLHLQPCQWQGALREEDERCSCHVKQMDSRPWIHDHWADAIASKVLNARSQPCICSFACMVATCDLARRVSCFFVSPLDVWVY